MRKLGWHRSILFRTAAVLVLLFVLLSTLALTLSFEYNLDRAKKASDARLAQLLDTVESTASVACFANDDVLAAELANGLLKNTEVLAVDILAGDQPLASGRRSMETQASRIHGPPLVRDVYSPFSPDLRVCQIRLTPNRALIERSMEQELRFATLQTAIQLALVAIAVVTLVLLQVVRPIKQISDGMHRMDATRGDRLPSPVGHRQSEIGLLVEDVNLLADHLVQALDDERALRIQREIDERRYHAIFQNAETGIFIMDAQGLLTSWNPAFERLMHLPDGSAPKTHTSLLDLGWKDPLRLAEAVLGCIDKTRSFSTDLAYEGEDGRDIWFNMVLTPIGDASFQGVIHDVTGHKEAEESAKRLAVTDPLTGVANRLGLERRLADLIEGCRQEQVTGFSLILIDVDDFKRINDGFGLPVGDEVLKEASRRLSACVKSSDLIARLGADQFALVLPRLQRGLDIECVARRIRERLQPHFMVAGSPIMLRVSLGIAIYPQDTKGGMADLLHHAELALTHAKELGGNSVQFFDPLLAIAIEQRRKLENDLRNAIREDEFVLYYQPIVDLVAGDLVGAEALIRWRHPERGLVPPDDFIPLAEESELINEIGLWALDVAVKRLALWREAGNRLYLSLNVSARQIPDGLPPKVILDATRRHGIEPGTLALEITEGVLLADLGDAARWLSEIRALGFPVYLDDFGTGYSSLSYLKRFAVDRLKVDKSFVRDIAHNISDRALVEAVVAMAKSLGIEVVAEGVEDPEHIQLLRGMGCRYAQGYYFSRPLPVEDFCAMCERIPLMLRNAER
ncbi:putative bifunctional diguanylate cyclase/phosphodiesterase [Imhoffiella purpurea]|uniref:Diguanylate cyclase n=1 Tax=Imhoffiella purpurea TaxID=1249627 RepID=W9V9T8_9GAMM|nr:EAL domain-containing protein [Imhoffiella purpurea]EXJ16219.1 diguanylate cyclase [Imhoffiella purpurea]